MKTPPRPSACPEATGALIGSVMPDEPAAKGGMKDGDVVLEVNGQKIDDSSALLPRHRYGSARFQGQHGCVA